MTCKKETSKRNAKVNFNFDIDLSDLNFDVCKQIHPFLEYRLKILTVSETTLKPGTEKTIPTNLILSQKFFPKHFQLQLKSSNKLPVKFLSEKLEVEENRLFVKLQNYNNFPIKICCKSPIAYLFFQPTNL